MIDQLIRQSVRNLKAYSSARSEFTGNAEIYLDANENPYEQELFDGINRYPDPLQREAKRKISNLKSVSADNIFLGNGSDECLDVLIRTVVEPLSEAVCICPPTYGMYEVLANINSVAVQSAPLTEEFALDLENIEKVINEKTKIIFICSPNNPTGNLMSEESIMKLLKSFLGFVVIDEAYIDFSGSRSWTTMLADFPRLIVIQTFSKAFGLAGLRLGTLFANPCLISAMNKVKYPYNIGLQTQKLICKFIDGIELQQQTLNETINQRELLFKSLEKIPRVKRIYKSYSNFLLVRFDDADFVFSQLREKGIIVRNRSSEKNCESCLRITVGTPYENNKLLQIMEAI